jgi:hypothetical protein
MVCGEVVAWLFPKGWANRREQALKDAPESSQIGTVMYALFTTIFSLSMRGRYEKAVAQLDELRNLL